MWEDFLVPLGHAMMPGVEQAIDRFHPDAVVADQFVLAAPVAARHREILGHVRRLARRVHPAARRPPEAEQEIRDHIGDFQLDHGIEDLLDVRFSDHLTLIFSTSALVGDTSFFPDHFAFVGPVSGRPAPCAFPWEWLDGRPPSSSPSAASPGRPPPGSSRPPPRPSPTWTSRRSSWRRP